MIESWVERGEEEAEEEGEQDLRIRGDGPLLCDTGSGCRRNLRGTLDIVLVGGVGSRAEEVKRNY